MRHMKSELKSKPLSKTDISAIMRSVRSSNTGPEVRFRRALWAEGLRYRTCSKKLPGKPDVVLSLQRLAIFIDGDFWHGGQWQQRSCSALEEQFKKTRSRQYWLEKIRRNMDRDCAATNALLSDGWTVLRFWERDVKNNLSKCIEKTLHVVGNGAKRDPFSVIASKTVAEFFAGIGLMRVGLEKQGWAVSFANDIDDKKHEMYKHHFMDESDHFLIGDIHKIPVERIPTVTLATASFPCNDLSLAGARAGLQGKQSSAFWGFIRILKELGKRRPPLVLLENVTGFLSSHEGRDFADALKALNRLGYLVDAFILDAARFVPQSRQRLFIVGHLKDCVDISEIHEPLSFYESDVRPRALADFIFTHPDIGWMIRNLPPQPSTNSQLQDLLEDIPDSSLQWWSEDRARYLFSQMSPRHQEIAMRMINGGQWSYGAVFRRVRKGKSMAELRTDGRAGCLRTPRGGSGRQILFRAGKGKYSVRLITSRECARLMGVGEYAISAPLNQALFGFGDAVCVPVVEWIAKYYLNPVVSELIRGRALIGAWEHA